MAVVKHDPLMELRIMQEEMNRLFNSSRARIGGEGFETGIWEPVADIYEDDREVVVKMELPEVAREDIDIHIEENVLIIQGERKLEREEKKHNYHRIERCYGPFRRTFSLPGGLSREDVRVCCEQGVLKVMLPKKGVSTSRALEVGEE
jgi:HSP20 family protein